MTTTDASTTTEENANPAESEEGTVDSDLPDAITKDEDQQRLVKLDAVYESLRYGEYDIRWGVAEFIDNSLDNDSNNVWTYIEDTEKEIDGKELEVVGQVAVVDDGTGMPEEELEGCLVLGQSFSPGSGGDRPIGRFGVGMTMAAISMARRIEVYSRTEAEAPFRRVSLDLDEVKEGAKRNFDSDEASPPEKYRNLIDGSSGTIVVLKKCDRLQHDPGAKNPVRASKQTEGIQTFLGRVYRKFISAGRRLWYNGNKVYLRDPLYTDGPTYFDAEKPGGPDPKATQVGNTIKLDHEVPGTYGEEEATIEVRVSLLPEEWRDEPGRGGEKFARERKIHQNEGISVLRADREVLYGKVPYLIGKKGQSKYQDIDRWWGLEISFPPELDDYFEVRYIKRGAQPVASVRDKIRDEITEAIQKLRQEIREYWSDEKRKDSDEEDAFSEAEEDMADADSKLPSSERGSDQDEEEAEDELDQIVDEDESTGDDESEKEKRKEEIKDKPYAIVPVKAMQSVFFEPKFLPGQIIIKLNTQHPFYKQVFAPLCGNITAVEEGEQLRNFIEDGDTEKQRLARKAMLLLLFSHSKAESMFNDKELKSVFDNLRTWWGTTLGTVLNE